MKIAVSRRIVSCYLSTQPRGREERKLQEKEVKSCPNPNAIFRLARLHNPTLWRPFNTIMKKISFVLFWIVGMLLFCILMDSLNASASDFRLPLALAPQPPPPLINLADRNFQKTLEYRLSQNKTWQKLIREQKMTVGLVDLSDPGHMIFVRINGSEMMYAASLPKVAVLPAAFHCFEYEGLEQTPGIMADLALMIRKSNNQASTRVIETITLQRIQQILMMPQYGFYDQDHGGGLWVGKKYAKTDCRLPDPLKGLSHAATATRCADFITSWPWVV